jgi:hypothetical protein
MGCLRGTSARRQTPPSAPVVKESLESRGGAHARAVANCSCASAGNHHAAAPHPCLVALTTSGRTEGTAHHPLRTPALSRAVCSAFEMKPGREEGWRRVDYPDSRILSGTAFHEKAGRSQVGCFVFRGTKFVSPAEWPLSPCFHPHSRGAIRFARCMLGVLVSAGAAI